MSTTDDTLENDIAWLKSLAETGRAAPLQTGPYLVAAGAWFGAASGLLALAQLRVLTLPANSVNWIWLLAGAGFVATLIVLIRRDRDRCESGYNRLINATWSAAGFGLFAFWAAATLLAVRLGDGRIMYTMALAVLTIYGIAWSVKGILTGIVWMRAIAIMSFASTIPVALASGTPYGWLAYSLALVATALIPGLYLVHVGGRAI